MKSLIILIIWRNKVLKLKVVRTEKIKKQTHKIIRNHFRTFNYKIRIHRLCSNNSLKNTILACLILDKIL